MNAPDYDVRQDQEEQLVLALKRVDCHVNNHEDTLDLAAALGLSKYFQPQETDDEQIKSNG